MTLHPPHRPDTPTTALAELLAGNQRFVTGTRIHPHQDAEHRAAIATGQRPFAVIFGCSDSRLAAEIIFDRGLGDLFVVRTAGHIIGDEVLASIAYGVGVLNVPLVVVLGHDSCGAIQATQSAITHDWLPDRDLRPIIDRITPSLHHAEAYGITDPDGIVDVHVHHTVELITQQSAAVAVAVNAGRCAVVGMSYRLADGHVTLINGAPSI